MRKLKNAEKMTEREEQAFILETMGTAALEHQPFSPQVLSRLITPPALIHFPHYLQAVIYVNSCSFLV